MPELRRSIVNASPLIVLHRIGRLGLLTRMYEEVVVPHGVLAEIEAGPGGKELRSVLETQGISVMHVTPDARIIEWDLGLAWDRSVKMKIIDQF